MTGGISDNGVYLENLPISDANSLVLQLVQAAGQGGGVIINLTPPEGLKILQAAEQQGLVDQVAWAWSTPGNDASVAAALDSQWNGKLGINAELNLIDSTGPSNTLYQQVVKQYTPNTPLGSFGQMGFQAADIFTKTALQLPEDQLTVEGVNAAIRKINNYQTDLLCKPWYFGDLPYHVPNNWDRTVGPQDHKMVQKEDCFEIAAIPESNLTQIRQAEQQQGLSH
jgi:branched-chain amino acid transport system substrate-binding protein